MVLNWNSISKKFEAESKICIPFIILIPKAEAHQDQDHFPAVSSFFLELENTTKIEIIKQSKIRPYFKILKRVDFLNVVLYETSTLGRVRQERKLTKKLLRFPIILVK